MAPGWRQADEIQEQLQESENNPRTAVFFLRPSLTDLTSLVGRFPRQMKACSDRFSDKSQVPL